MDLIQAVYRVYIRHVFRRKYGDALFPRTLRLEINSHCNRRCPYCPNSFAPHPVGIIEQSVLTAFLRRIHEIDWRGAVDFIFFNEPLLHPAIVEIVDRVKRAAPRCHPVVSTNGDLLTDELCDELVRAGVRRIFPMRHEPYKLGWTDRIERLYEKHPRVIRYDVLDRVERESGLFDYGGKVKVRRRWAPHLVNGQTACDLHEIAGQIDIRGEWLLCCVDYGRTHSFGNIKDKGLLEIWRSKQFTAARDVLRAGRPPFSACRQCGMLNLRECAPNEPEAAR